jgi:hypothetical protein
LGSAGRIIVGLKCPGSSGSGTFATGTTSEIFHEAGKHSYVMEVLNICVITERMNERKFLINFSGTSSRPIAFEPI